MTKRSRRIIFYIFLIAFIILTPSIIFYARGYAFDFEKRIIVATGGIYLKTHPQKADIYINDKPRGKTTKFIKRLIPKVYRVKIIKQDYHLWQKELTVEPRLVNKVDNIFLVPFNPKITLVATESESYSFFEEPYSLLQVTELIKRKSNYTILDINNVNFDVHQEKIYFLSKNNLYYLSWDKENPENSSPSPLLLSNVINYAIGRNKIIYLEYFTGQIYELNLNNLESKPIFEQVFPSFNEGKWILSNDKKKLLCQKNKSVEILWLDRVVNNPISREKGDIEKIDFEEKINDVIWLPQTDEHLIVSTDSSILITELDGRPPRNTINFITTEKPEIKYDASNKILYFLSQNRLYQTEL